MKYVKYALHKCCWLFVPSSIRRALSNESETRLATSSDTVETPILVGLAPKQFQALSNMYKYAPAEQVRDLLSVYESANKEKPVNPQTAVWVSKQDIMAPKPNLKVMTR